MHCHLHMSFFKKHIQFINYALVCCLYSYLFEGVGSPGAVVMDSSELLSGCWKFNPGPCPLKEHGVPTEPSLQVEFVVHLRIQKELVILTGLPPSSP